MKKKITFTQSTEKPSYSYHNSNVLILESDFPLTKKQRFSKATLNVSCNITSDDISVYLDKNGNITDFTNLSQNLNAVKLDTLRRTEETNEFNVTRAFYELSKQETIPETQRFIVVGSNLQTVATPTHVLAIEYDENRSIRERKALLPFNTENVSGGINLAEKTLEFEIADTVGIGRMPINVKHVYNSRLTSNYDTVILDNGTKKNLFYCAGYGFKLNYQQYLIVDSAVNGTLSDGESSVQYVWVDAKGDLIRFNKNATTNEITCEYNYTLTVNSDGNYEISDLSNNRLTFSPSSDSAIYRLTKITDSSGNYLTLNYSGINLISIVQNNANKVEIEYDEDSGVICLIKETVNGSTMNVTFGANGDFCIEEVYFAKNGNALSNKNVYLRYISMGDNEYCPCAIYESNGIGYYFDCGLGEYEELHLLSTTDGIEGGSVKELTPATSGDYVTVNNVNCPIQRLYDVDSGERWARVINEKTNEKVLYTFDYFGNCVSVIEENYDVSGTKTPQAKSFTKTGKYLDVTVSRELNLVEYLSNSIAPGNSTTDFSQFDLSDLYIMNPFKAALESKTDSDRKIYYSDTGELLFSIKDERLTYAITDAASTGLAVSAWVKADSLPIVPVATGLQINNGEEEFVYNEKTDNGIDERQMLKRFDLCAKVIFDNGEPKIFKNSFDWTRKDFQYVETFVILNEIEWVNVREIQVYVDYAFNNGRIYLYGGAMINGALSLNHRNEKLQTVLQESSKNKLSTTYFYENNKVVRERTYRKNFSEWGGQIPDTETADNTYEYFYNVNAEHEDVERVTDKNGLITDYTYSQYGDLVSTKVYHPNLTNSDEQPFAFFNKVVYNEIGDIKEVKNEFDESVGTYEYAHNAVSKITDFKNSETVFGYDPTYSLLTSVQSTVSGTLNKNSTDFTAGTPIKDTDVASNATNGNTTIEYDYDGFGNVTAIYVNGSLYCSIKYQNDYKKKTVTYANGDILIYNQDIDNGVEFSRYYTRNPNNQGSTEFEMKFDSFGRFKDLETEDMGGTKIAQKYNDDGTTRKSYVECEDDIFYDLSRETEYGDDRKVSKQTIRHKDGNSEYIVDEITPTYDDQDRLTAVQHKNTFNEGVEYDELGRVKELTKVAFRLSSEDNESVEEMNAHKKTFSYKTDGTKTSNLISSEMDLVIDSSITISSEKFDYSYDSEGRLTEVGHLNWDEGQVIRRYTYDGLGRLTQEYNADFGTTFNYSYDNAGNITEKSYEQTNSQGQTEQITKTYTYSNGRLTNYNGYTILYDEIGNPVTCFNNSLEWTHGHRLKKYYGAEFEYNYAGIRLKKTANGKTTKYALEGDKIIAIEQTDGNTTQNMTFYYGVDGVSGFEYDGEQYFYRKNIFGDILGIYKNAELIVKYAYDAWGVNKTYVSDGSNWVLLENSAALDSNSDYARNVRIAKLNPFLYRGYCYDRETRLYYLNARYYDPQVGRFISPDDINYLDPTTINGLNLYAYCANNPVMYSDPSGHFGIRLFGPLGNPQVVYDINKIVQKNGWIKFYKGVPVFYFESDFLSSFSFGFIFMNKNDIEPNDFAHEWGHTRQLQLLGIGDYFNMIALPSLITNLIDRKFKVDYYTLPWEVTADMFGGVNREGTNQIHKNIGVSYLVGAEFLSNTVVKPLMLPLYTTAAAMLDGVIPGLGTTLLGVMYST